MFFFIMHTMDNLSSLLLLLEINWTWKLAIQLKWPNDILTLFSIAIKPVDNMVSSP